MHCFRNLRRALALLGFAVLLLSAEEPRVATIDFSLAEAVGSHDPDITAFSRDVQARLLLHNEYLWVERQEFDRIEREVDLAALAQVDAASAVRLGHWLHADLLVRGEVVRPTQGHGELVIEVIELKRAELLATRTTSVTVNVRNLVRPVAADADAAAAAAVAALQEAVKALERNRTVRVIAPLCFRNIGPTERLNFLEARLTAALASAASPASGCRLLRFPRASEAGDEAELVFAGLTDSDPDAWQRVADFYVWGAFSEGNSEGIAFDDVPVAITAQVWNGAGAPRIVRWDGLVHSLDQGVQSVAAGVMELTQTRAAAADRNDADRKRIAKELAARNSDSRKSVVPRNQQAYDARLLEIACFFDPLNRDLQHQRAWGIQGSDSLAMSDPVRRQWLSFARIQSYARRFERAPDGSIDWNPRVDTTSALESICHLLWYPPATRAIEGVPTMTPEENLRQFRSAVELWCREVAAANRPFAGQVLPERLESFNKGWLYHLTEFLGHDTIIARNAIEAAWPWLKKAAGRDLRENPESKLPAQVIGVYAAFGDFTRARTLLDEAWQAAGVGPAAATGLQTQAASATAPGPERWGPVQPSEAGNSTLTAPPLNAAVRELDLWPANVYFDHYRDRPLTKHRQPRVTSLAWHRGELWVGQTLVRASDPKTLLFAGNNILWRYDPALQTVVLATEQLRAHSAVRALLSQSDQLWLGLESDGVWQWPAGQAEVRRFKGEDGLATSQVYAAAASGRLLFFLGGNPMNRVIAYYSVDSGNWFVTRIPFPPLFKRFADGPPKAYAPEIAVCGDWIAVISPQPAFGRFADKTWTRWPGTPPPPVGPPARPPGPTGPSGSTSPPALTRATLPPADMAGSPAFAGNPSGPPPPGAIAYTCLSADDSGFWLGTENAILQIDPRAPETKRLIPLPGTPVAAAHDGTQLWLVLETKEGESKLALFDKYLGQCTGLLTLPVANLNLLIGDPNLDGNRISPGEMHFNRIATANGHVWVGGPALFEITLRETAAPADNATVTAAHPLHRAAWRGDLAATEAALAANAEVNEQSASGWTPLLAAVDNGREAVVRALLRAGAQPNRLSHSGKSPLEIAAERGDLELVRLLLESGAKPDLNPGIIVRGLGRFWHPAELQTPNLDAMVAPIQPANLQANLTEDGSVALSWEVRSNNESVFRVARSDDRVMPGHGIADLPAGSRSWVDETPPRGLEVGYWVYALNGADRSAAYAAAPVIWLKVPAAPPANVIDWRAPPEPQAPVIESRTPLMAAAENGHLPVLSALLAAKASLDLRDPVGQTALLLAVQSGCYAAARALLAAGAQPDLADATGRTAAQAVYERHEDEALWREMLLTLDPSRRIREASRLIHLAAEDGQIHDLETLRSLGGNIDAVTQFGGSALSFAIANRRFPAVAWLLGHGFPLQRKHWFWAGIDTLSTEALTAAIETGDPQYLGALLDAGIPVDYTIGGTPLLSLAAKQGKTQVVALLIDRGANIKLPSFDGRLPASFATTAETQALFAPKHSTTWLPPKIFWGTTCGPEKVDIAADPAKAAVNARLFAACKTDDCAAVVSILAEGAQIDVQDDTGMRPLTQALKARAFRAARCLVENGAAVNLPTKKGNCPLVFSVEAQDTDATTFLLRAGSDPNAFGGGGSTPLIVAAEKQSRPLAELLLDAGADPNLAGTEEAPPLACALRKGDAGIVDLLLAHGANPRAQRFNSVADSRTVQLTKPSLLMYAAAGGNVDLIRQMIALGQDPRYTTRDGYDALAWAAGAGRESAVSFLLPLVDHSPHALAKAMEKGNNRIVEQLRRAGYQ